MKKETWSYSKIDEFKTCPFKFYLHHIKGYKEPQDSSVALQKGNLVHLLLEQKASGEVDLEDKDLRELMDKLAKEDITKTLRQVKKFIEGDFWRSLNLSESMTETWFYLDKTLSPCSKPDAFVLGKIDYMEPKEEYLLLVDWKTGKKTAKEVTKYKKDDLQLDLYALWGLQKFDYESVNALLYYIETNVTMEKVYSKQDIPALKRLIAEKILEIRKTETFERNPGPLCDYCGFFAEFCNTK